MGFGEKILEAREERKMTQRQLADRIGCSDAYITHMEKELRVPSMDIVMALAGALEISEQRQEELIEAVETARLARTHRRVHKRGISVRSALQKLGVKEASDTMDVEQIADDLANDPDLREAFQYLRRAMCDPEMKPAVLTALRSFAQTAKTQDC